MYDTPRARDQRITDSGIMTVEKVAKFAALFEVTKPAELTRKITTIQTRLINLAQDKSDAVMGSVSRAKIGSSALWWCIDLDCHGVFGQWALLT